MEQLEGLTLKQLKEIHRAAHRIVFYGVLAADMHVLMNQVRKQMSFKVGVALSNGAWKVYDRRTDTVMFEGGISLDVLDPDTPPGTHNIAPCEYHEKLDLRLVRVIDDREIEVNFMPIQVDEIDVTHKAIYLLDANL